MPSAPALLAACVLFVLIAPCSAGASDVLLIAPGARPAGMADCFVAVADDASAAFWNPGGLPFIEDRLSFVGMQTEPLPDWGGFDYWYGAVAYRAGRFANFALSYTSLKWPALLFFPDPMEPDYVMFAPSERVLLFSYALVPLENLGLGVSLKHLRTEELPSDLSDTTDGTASAVAFDIGALYRLPRTAGAWDAVLGIGANVQHLGGDLELDGELYGSPQKWALPRNLKLGASCRVGKGPALQTLFCFEFNRPFPNDENAQIGQSDDPIYGLGLEVETSITALTRSGADAGELGTRDVLALRLGYVHDDAGEITGYSYGFGIGIEGGIGSLRFDIANVPQCCDLTRPWRYGLTASLVL